MPAAEQAASVGIMPTLNRNMATTAAAESSSAQRSTLASTGASKDRPEAPHGPRLAEHRVDREPDREVQHDADHGRRDRRQGPVQGLVAAQRLDEGRARGR